ncbi:hypothetical protein Sjap_013729 [Stephania japonica]|uniref:Uncharacterized protein n=1 Tax=Stephania japonica TaxID=461633 RepID=A0AAP0J0F9_9MAGN
MLIGMARTKRSEDVRKAEKARKIEEVNKKTVEMGKRVGRSTQTASCRKSKELRRGKGDSELHDEASASQASKGRELTIRSSQVSLAETTSPKSSEEDQGRSTRPIKRESEDEKVEEEEGGEIGEDEEEEEEGENGEEEEEEGENGEDEEGTKEQKEEQNEEEKEQNEEENVEAKEVRANANVGGKAMSRPSGKKIAENRLKEPFSGGPTNKELLTSFHNHVATT